MGSADVPTGNNEAGVLWLPKGLAGAGFVTLYSADGMKRGEPKHVRHYLVKFLVLLIEAVVADNARGEADRGWMPYAKAAELMAIRHPGTLTPNASSLVSYASVLKRLLRDAADENTQPLLETMRQVGVRLRAPLRIIDDTELLP